MSSYVKVRASQQAAYLEGFEAIAGASTQTTTVFVPVNQACNWLAHVGAGTVETSVDFQVLQATDSAGSGAKTLKAITQLTAAGSALINFNQGDMDVTNGFAFVGLELITVGTTTVAGAELMAFNAVYEPLAQSALIDEVIL